MKYVTKIKDKKLSLLREFFEGKMSNREKYQEYTYVSFMDGWKNSFKST